MFTFLRKIRKSLIDKGSIQRYFLYAIGEIALVVIGILLALQINSWNQERVSRIEEKAILQNLNREFSQNEADLNEKLALLNNCIASCIQVMDLIGKNEAELNRWNIDSLMFFTIEFNDYSPSSNVIADLLQSGRLHLLTDEKLRDFIFEWTRTLKQKDIEYATVQKWIDDNLIPYLIDNMSLKNIDHYGGKLWDRPTLLKYDNQKAFQDIEFENNMDNWVYNLRQLQKEFVKLGEIVDGIIETTKS